MSYGYIYKTTNLKNNKIYIGKKKGQFTSKYYGSGLYIKRSLNKEGKNNFKLELIVYADSKNKLGILEKNYITEYRKLLGNDKLYNLSDGGDGGDLKGFHKENCGCCFCKAKRKEWVYNHKLGCKCCSCKSKRGESSGRNNPMFGKKQTHKITCQCFYCKSKRGEYSGKNHPMFGVSRFGKDNPNYRHGKYLNISNKERINNV